MKAKKPTHYFYMIIKVEEVKKSKKKFSFKI